MNESQKYALRYMINQFLEQDEPEAILAVIKRIAEIKAYKEIKRTNPDLDECGRWLRLAEVLTKAEEAYLKDED